MTTAMSLNRPSNENPNRASLGDSELLREPLSPGTGCQTGEVNDAHRMVFSTRKDWRGST